jgi:hypothetical protein
MLVGAFKGGSGYKKKLNLEDNSDTITISLDFPSKRAAKFISDTVLEGFIAEGFFVSSIESSHTVYQIRKESTIIMLDIMRIEDNQASVKLTCQKDDEAFVRLMLLDSIADFQAFASTLSSMQDPEMMSAQLLMSMFNED